MQLGPLYNQGESQFDFATLIGGVTAFGLVVLAIALGGSLATFFDIKALVIVLGGTLGATLLSFPIEDFKKTWVVLQRAVYPDEHYLELRIERLLEFARQARSEGELSLEQSTYIEPDPFFQKCIELVVDGVSPEEIRRMLNLELNLLDDRHRRGAQLFQTMGNIAPAMGLIGTLIGLVRMLEYINDPTQIGPAMATALLTTFYGAVLAHMLFLPLAGKLRARSEEELLLKQMTIEGTIDIAQNSNPRLIERKLLAYLPPERRYAQFAQQG